MKIVVTTTLLVFHLIISANAGVSMDNPFYCYSTDLIRPQVQMHSTRTSYEAVRRTSVNPAASCKNKLYGPPPFFFLMQEKLIWFSLYSIKILVPKQTWRAVPPSS